MQPEPHIWIIDDDELFIMITRNNIRKSGVACNTEDFKNGKDALYEIKERVMAGEHIPNILLLDLNMPLIDGWDFLEEFKSIPLENRKKVKIYICTSSIDPKDLKRAEAIAEVTAFLEKPINTEVIQKIVTSL
jgi:two-component system chemotaxis response regulator CheY